MVSFETQDSVTEDGDQTVPADEIAALEYFTTHTLSILSHSQPSMLWEYTSPKLIESSSALYEAAIAIGARHLWLTQPDADPAWNDRSLRWYSLAVGSLRETISEQNPDTIVIALASLLCILFESLQGRTSELLIHLHNGVRYVFEDPNFRNQGETCDIAGLLSRVGITSMLHNATGAPARETQEVMRRLRQRMGEDDDKSSLQKLHVQFSAVFSDTFEHLRFLKHGLYETEEKKDKAKIQLERRLKELLAMLEMTQLSDIPMSFEQWECHKALLQAHCLMCLIYAEACGSGYQTSYDRFVRKFQLIVAKMEKSLAYLNSHPAAAITGRLPFSFGLAHSTTLTLVVFACRHNETRYKALELLRKCPKRDGLWDADERLKICHILVDFEETGADDFDENGKNVSIPEEFRVHDFHDVRVANNKLAVTIQWKPRRDYPMQRKRIEVEGISTP